MKNKDSRPAQAAKLRRQAEAKLTERKKKATVTPETKADTQRLVHELEVHQIELEMQNEELVQSRAQVEAGLRQYTDLYDLAPGGYFMLARDGAIHKLNLAGANLLGVERGALIKRRFGVFVSVESRPAFSVFLEKVFESRKKESCETAIMKDGQETRWTHIEATCIEDGQECRAVVSDITERKRAEEALQQSRTLLAEAEKVAHLGSWEWNLVTGEAKWSEEMYRIHGQDPNSFVANSQSFINLIHADDRKIVDTAMEHAIAKGEVTNYEYRIVLANGSVRVMHGEGVVTDSDKDGKPSRMLGTAQDISERKKAEEILRESEERLKILFEYAPDAYCLSTPEGTILDVNKAAFELFGYQKEEVIGKTLMESGVISPEQFEGGTAATAYGPDEPIEMVLNRKDGTKVIVEMKTFPVEIKGQTLLLSIARDITERQQAKERLQQSLNKLGKAMNGTVQAIRLMAESRDRYTAGHQKRVAQLACAIARELGFTPEQIQVISIAGLLHDIGKIALPQEILSKPGKLSDIEFNLVKAHSQAAYDILTTVEFPWPIADIVIQHHERMDGSGYPSGIREDNILLEARILGVSDVVEAMSSHRPYRVAPGLDKALEEISRNSGILYDPSVVEACVGVFTEKAFAFEG